MAAPPPLSPVPPGLPAHGFLPPTTPTVNPRLLSTSRMLTPGAKANTCEGHMWSAPSNKIGTGALCGQRGALSAWGGQQSPPLSAEAPQLPLLTTCGPHALNACGFRGLKAAAKHGAMPAWFQAWDFAHFQPFKQILDLLHINFAIIRAQFANGQCATEHQAPSEDVPFTSGDDPC
ncbi:hypothetical protein DFH09DRAFT_1101036 [Mycena vulgaris]|nr:hypothetical protein DFH09DRAFT_1101036 [Mycena vulgaris]